MDQQQLLLSARFVVHDQWLTTRVSSSWNVSQLKAWLLSKCLHLPLASDLVPTPDPPPSPITFAPNPRKGINPIFPTSLATGLNDNAPTDSDDPVLYGYEEDDEYDSDDLMNAAASKTSATLKKKRRRSSILSPSSSDNPNRQNNATALNYVLLRFSTGQVLEDDFSLAWYALRPFELVEIHPSSLLVNLPRHFIPDYCKPYFRARVRLLRVIEGRLHFQEDPDPLTYRPDPGVDRYSRTRVEWRDRWLVLRDETLHLCKSETSLPIQSYPLETMQGIYGPQHLVELDSSSSTTSPRLICAKFSSSSFRPPRRRDKLAKRSASLTRRSSKKGHKPSHVSNFSVSTIDTHESTSVHQPLAQKPSVSPVRSKQQPPREAPKASSSLGHNSLPNADDGLDAPASESSGGSSRYSSPVFAPIANSSDEDDLVQSLTLPPVNSPDPPQDTLPLDGRRIHDPVSPPFRRLQFEGDWVVLDMLDETAYTSLLRILHRLGGPDLKSSFLSTLAPLSNSSTLIGSHSSWVVNEDATMIGSSSTTRSSLDSGLQHPKSLALEPAAKVSINTFGALPYPEWRMEITGRATQSGLGDVNKAMENWLRYQHGLDEEEETDKDDSVPPSASTVRSSVSDRVFLRRLQIDLNDEDSDGSNHSASEWAGWMGDLPRQGSRPRQLEHQPSSPSLPRRPSLPDITPSTSAGQVYRRVYEPSGIVTSTMSYQKFSTSSPYHSPPSPNARRTIMVNPMKPWDPLVSPTSQHPRPLSPTLLDAYSNGGRSASSTWASRSLGLERRSSIASALPTIDRRTVQTRPSRDSLESTTTATASASHHGSDSTSSLWRSEQGHHVSKRASFTVGPRRSSSAGTMPHYPISDVGRTSHVVIEANGKPSLGDRRSQRSFSPPSVVSRTALHGRSISSSHPTVRRVKSEIGQPHESMLSPAERAHTPTSYVTAASGSKAEKKKGRIGLMKGLSLRTEKFVRGLDAALDFVDEQDHR